MDLKIVKEEKNIILKRREITAEVDFSGEKTPSREMIKDKAVKILNAKEELVFISKVSTTYGKQTGEVKIVVYDDQEAMKALEGKYMFKKHEKKVEKNKEEAGAE